MPDWSDKEAARRAGTVPGYIGQNTSLTDAPRPIPGAGLEGTSAQRALIDPSTFTGLYNETDTGQIWRSDGSSWARFGTYAPIHTAQRQLVPVASRAAPPYGFPSGTAALSDGVVAGGTSKIQHVMLASANTIVLAFTNTYNNNGTETSGPQDITVAAAVEPLGTVMYPVSFNGQMSVTIKPGQTVYSDPLAVGNMLPKGTAFWTRTFISVAAAATKFPVGGPPAVGANNEGNNYAAGIGADLTPTGSAAVPTTSSRAFGPAMILGLPTTTISPVIGIVGDSIAAGANDTDIGFILRALGGNYLYQSVAYPSELVDGWKQSNGLTRYRRASMLARAGVTHIICELGINSISNGSVQANLLAVWQYLAGFGVPVYQTTITPSTTSTDSWATTANQTVTANEAARVALNTYIRTVPAPLAGIFEVADLAETARNSGKWIVTGAANYATSDGKHPSPAAAALLAAAINPAIFGAVAV